MNYVKYGNKRTKRDGYNFSSRLEADVYSHLKLLESGAEISDIRCQVQVRLTAAGIIYKPDFLVTSGDEEIFVEAKGIETATWRIKRKLWQFYGPGPLEIYKRRGSSGIFLAETIIPKGAENGD